MEGDLVKPNSSHWPQIYLCVALTTMATLLVELSITRIFSVVLYYHFAFLAISIALFGLGAGGVFSYVVAGWKAPLFLKLGRLSALNSLLVVVALVVILAQKGDVGDLGWGTFWKLAAIYFTTALPFFVSGAIVSLAISETIERVNRVYFFDLLGAAAGCLLLLLLLRIFGGETTVLAAAVIFAAAAAIWHSLAGSVRGRAASVALALLLVSFVTYNKRHHVLDIRHAKGNDIPVEAFVKWNTFSRIALVDKKAEGRETIVIDADASTGIATFDFDHLTNGQRHDLLEQGPALPYAVRPGAKALIIGPGGGWDVARALASGSRDITGVEINPIIATTIMREKYPALSHYLTCGPTYTSWSRTAAASCAAAPPNTRWCRPRWWTPGPPPQPAPSRFPRTISTPRTPSATTCSISPTMAWWPSRAGDSIRRANPCGWCRWRARPSRNWARTMPRSTSSWDAKARWPAGARATPC